LKDNIDTADHMQTAAGSLALVGSPPLQDATVAGKLRQAGAVILAKTNLSEWANFRSIHSSSGWSGRGGQANNPYAIDRNPCGSSSGSAAATSASFAAASLGTETDGSIVCPANANGVVGIKPTLGLTSRAGVVPISHNQDVVGPHGRTVADAAAVLGAIASKTADPRDPATSANRNKVFTDYTQFVNTNGLAGARIGVARNGVTGFSDKADAVYEAAIQIIKNAGAFVVDPADIPTINEIQAGASEFVVLIFDFKRDLNAYLATRAGVPIKTLADAIAFNEAHAAEELKFFGQELFVLAQSDPFDQATYNAAVAHDLQIGGPQGIDAVLQQFNLHAIVAPTGSPAWTTDLVNGDHFIFASSSPAAIAGYPAISLPMGNSFGLPVGITFMGTAFSEPTLIKVASGFEHAAGARLVPQFLPGLPFDSIKQNDSARRVSTSAEETMAWMRRMRTSESEEARLARARGR
jgi:amidase